MNESAQVLIEGVALVMVSDGGNCLAHWIKLATDADVLRLMRDWAERETHRQGVKLRRDSLHIAGSVTEVLPWLR